MLFLRRLTEIIQTFELYAHVKQKLEVGNIHLVLADGFSKRGNDKLSGRTDTNKTVNFVYIPVPELHGEDLLAYEPPASREDALQRSQTLASEGKAAQPQVGEYVAVLITEGLKNSLVGVPLFRTSLQEFARVPHQWAKLPANLIPEAEIMQHA